MRKKAEARGRRTTWGPCTSEVVNKIVAWSIFHIWRYTFIGKYNCFLQFSRLHGRLENGPRVSGPLRGPCMA